MYKNLYIIVESHIRKKYLSLNNTIKMSLHSGSAFDIKINSFWTEEPTNPTQKFK